MMAVGDAVGPAVPPPGQLPRGRRQRRGRARGLEGGRGRGQGRGRGRRRGGQVPLLAADAIPLVDPVPVVEVAADARLEREPEVGVMAPAAGTDPPPMENPAVQLVGKTYVLIARLSTRELPQSSCQ